MIKAHSVDLVVNCFERTYRDVLTPGYFDGIHAQNRREFARRIVLINNVVDLKGAISRAQRLVRRGDLDGFEIVDEQLDRALRVTGLHREGLQPLLHHSDCVLVAVTMSGSPWILYWDAEAQLETPHDWVTPALDLMERDPRLLAANPSWESLSGNGQRPGLTFETVETREGFAIGRGFSDQVFLARRRDLAAPIYRQRCLAQIRFPAAHKAATFESRIDAHMRHHSRFRATSLDATYRVDDRDGGSSYSPEGPIEIWRFARNAFLRRAIRSSPWRPPCCRQAWF